MNIKKITKQSLVSLIDEQAVKIENLKDALYEQRATIEKLKKSEYQQRDRIYHLETRLKDEQDKFTMYKLERVADNKSFIDMCRIMRSELTHRSKERVTSNLEDVLQEKIKQLLREIVFDKTMPF